MRDEFASRAGIPVPGVRECTPVMSLLIEGLSVEVNFPVCHRHAEGKAGHHAQTLGFSVSRSRLMEQ